VNNEFQKETFFLKKIYKNIIDGYSRFFFKKENIYLKHLKESEFNEIYEIYEEYFAKSKAKGLLEEKEKLSLLIEKNLWSLEKDEEIKSIEEKIKHNQLTIKNLVIKKQIEQFKKDIEDLEKKSKELRKEREEAIGLTCESFALQKANEYVIYLSFFKDKNFYERCFKNKKAFEEVEPNILSNYLFIYNKYNQEINEKNIKKISISVFFSNNFYLCEDDPIIFYGKPIVELSRNQLDLFAYGKYFKNYLASSKVVLPTDYDSMDELLAWYESKEDYDKIFNKKTKIKDRTGTTYIGASKEEIEKMVRSQDPSAKIIDLQEEAKKAGKDLSFAELIKLHEQK
jgi:hypothetical protein